MKIARSSSIGPRVPSIVRKKSIASMYTANFGLKILHATHEAALKEEEVLGSQFHKKTLPPNFGSDDELTNMKFHTAELYELIHDLETDEVKGLTTEKAKEKLSNVGPNKLEEKHELVWPIQVLLEMFGTFSILLWIAAGLCFLAYSIHGTSQAELYLGIVIVLVIVTSGIFSYYENSTSEKTIERFVNKDYAPHRTNVIRDGKEKAISPTELVPGDIINVKVGDKIPADIRLISTHKMKVDNYSLTGQTEPLLREPHCTKERVLEAENMAFFGSNCVEGTGVGVVVLTGPHTILGRIMALAQPNENSKTMIAAELKWFVRVIAIISVGLGGIFFLFSLAYEEDVLVSLIDAIGIIVANAPEGLLITLTIALAASARKLGKKGIVIKNLQAIEALGCVSCICVDKTGPITIDSMEPSRICLMNQGKEREIPIEEVLSTDTDIRHFAEKVGLSGTNEVANKTEECVAKFVSSVIDLKEIKEKSPVVFESPFNSARKYSYVIRKIRDESNNFAHHLLLIKGSADKILRRCNQIYTNGHTTTLTSNQKESLTKTISTYSSYSERVIAFAYLELDPKTHPEFTIFFSHGDNKNIPHNGFVFLGLVSLKTPLRPDVVQEIDRCREAGIKVVMITGDHPETAKAAAQQCHILTDLKHEYYNMVSAGVPPEIAERKCRAIVVHGDELAIKHRLDSKRLPEDPEKDLYLQHWLNKKEVVFSMMNPALKPLVVSACQKLGHIVAVTGEEVNDSPAIERADVGIAIGDGSEVTKDVADIVLTRGGLKAVVDGVEESRLLFDNMKKCIVYNLASNVPELIPFLLYVIFQIPLPITTLLVLLIDVGTDLWPGISFAYEPAELDIMRRKPRKPKQDLLVSRKVLVFAYLQIGVIETFAGMFAYFTVMADYGFKPMNLFFYAFAEGCLEGHPVEHYEWAGESHAKVNVMDFYKCNRTSNMKLSESSYYVPIEDTLDTVSPITGEKVRYTSEALKYAQTSFWVAIIVTQWATYLICKTRSLSIVQHGLHNRKGIYGLVFGTCLALVVIYVPFLNEPLGTRGLDLRHLGMNVVPFLVLIVLYDEVRKYLIRNAGGYPKYSWLYRNTFY